MVHKSECGARPHSFDTSRSSPPFFRTCMTYLCYVLLLGHGRGRARARRREDRTLSSPTTPRGPPAARPTISPPSHPIPLPDRPRPPTAKHMCDIRLPSFLLSKSAGSSVFGADITSHAELGTDWTGQMGDDDEDRFVLKAAPLSPSRPPSPDGWTDGSGWFSGPERRTPTHLATHS